MLRDCDLGGFGGWVGGGTVAPVGTAAVSGKLTNGAKADKILGCAASQAADE